MSKIQLNLGELILDLELIERKIEGTGGPYLDWIYINTNIKMRSFSCSFIFEVMPNELLNLADDLEKLYNQYPNHGSVSFIPVEHSIELNFNIGSRGQLRGSFSVRDDHINYIELNGEFVTDQMVLLNIACDLRKFVKESEPNFE